MITVKEIRQAFKNALPELTVEQVEKCAGICNAIIMTTMSDRIMEIEKKIAKDYIILAGGTVEEEDNDNRG